jgi:hypothetical protein
VVKFLAALNPAADVMALASLEVDTSSLEPGNCMIVKWRGKPVFVRARTEEEIAEAQDVAMGELRDPQTDDERVQKPETLVLIGVCTRTPRPPRVRPPHAATQPGMLSRPRSDPHRKHSALVSLPSQTSAACRSTAPAISMDGSAPAMARTTTPRGAFARAPRPSTLRSRRISSSMTPRSWWARRTKIRMSLHSFAMLQAAGALPQARANGQHTALWNH